MTFFFACRAQDYTFCLLIVRYMLSDKIKGKSALKARTFLRERDKVHVCCMVEAVYASIDGKQCRLKYIGEMFTYKKHSIHRNSSAMVIYFNMVTDIKQTRLGQGLGVTFTARKRPCKLNYAHHEGLRSYAAWLSKFNINFASNSRWYYIYLKTTTCKQQR